MTTPAAPGPGSSSPSSPAASSALVSAGPSSAKPARIAAGVGLVAVVLDVILCMILVLVDAYEPGDGRAGAFVDAGMGSLWASGLTGLAALCLPAAVTGRAVRSGLVAAQYAFLVLAPVLVLLD
ncbi:hypothetical protein [Streptomyces sp. GC420]|uniref:hypothetical protein n=1 Tax=Streptomyces sp. GC420 TaxID=2697568 RepID=UPI001414CDAE|nr:hypothetical protein [Streptomyces sp. GC420]NBM20507.1 hypothetical protein [Streptomyces sp. GC420]